VTDTLKVRAGVRQGWWNTALTPLISVPGGTFNSEGVLLAPGVTQTRDDSPVSWNVGAVYKLFPGASPFVGVSKSYLSSFNSENAQTGIGAPESALQYAGGNQILDPQRQVRPEHGGLRRQTRQRRQPLLERRR
jgi:iron complex outermembrane receptor protein